MATLPSPPSASLVEGLLERVDARRLALASRDRGHKSKLGQFFTPAATARILAGMCESNRDFIRLLDAGAGVGSLTAAWVATLDRANRPKRVELTAYEVDPALHLALSETLSDCEAACSQLDIACTWTIRGEDFIEHTVNALDDGLFQGTRPAFDIAILNPPYKKFRAESTHRALLRQRGIETSNLYTAFLALAVEALAPEGELVAITPRSFCNGPYFAPFRTHLLDRVSLTRVHSFESRDDAFSDDEVLQENIIFRAVRTRPQQSTVRLTESRTPDELPTRAADVSIECVVHPGDRARFIHLLIDEADHALAASMQALPCTLADLDLTVSTGRVVEYRAREWLRPDPEASTVPIIYPTHFDSGRIAWPKPGSKKPNAIVRCADSSDLLIASGVYVLVKRFSSKEEARRIVAAVFDPADVACPVVGFENHLNYFHSDGKPLDPHLARGLMLFLNSTPVDSVFRQFSGHTQVNAADLRTLSYPDRASLLALGSELGTIDYSQDSIDRLVAKHIHARQ